MKLLLILAVLAAGAFARAAEYRWETPPAAGNEMAVRLWFADGTQEISFIILHVSGHNGDSRPFADDAAWREFAGRRHCALLGIRMKDGKDGFYYEPRLWSGHLLFRALADLSEQSTHPEISRLKLLVWGHSAGGQFAYNLACWQPGIVKAFVLGKGAFYKETTTAESRKIPALCVGGAADTELRLHNITSLFAENRSKGAPWILAIEPGTGHEGGQTGLLAKAFFEGVLENSGKADPWATAWIGSLADHEIRPYDPQKDAKPSPLTVQLPDENFARIWQAFVRGLLPDKPEERKTGPAGAIP